MEDDIFRVFGGDKMKGHTVRCEHSVIDAHTMETGLLDSFRVSEDLPIESTLVVSSLNSVQQSVERYLFEVRNQVRAYELPFVPDFTQRIMGYVLGARVGRHHFCSTR
jgi:preprotein translocase subunit SecA